MGHRLDVVDAAGQRNPSDMVTEKGAPWVSYFTHRGKSKMNNLRETLNNSQLLQGPIAAASKGCWRMLGEGHRLKGFGPGNCDGPGMEGFPLEKIQLRGKTSFLVGIPNRPFMSVADMDIKGATSALHKPCSPSKQPIFSQAPST